MPAEPGWQPRRFRCLKCKDIWCGWLPMFCAFDVWIAVAKVMRCPYCGAGSRRIVFDDLKPERVDAGRRVIVAAIDARKGSQ